MSTKSKREDVPQQPTLQQSPQTEEELDTMIAAALDCPCVEDLKQSPCGDSFKAAFTCFHKSRAVPKGYDCEGISLGFTECLRENPQALASFQSASAEGALSIPPGPPDSPFAKGDPAA